MRPYALDEDWRLQSGALIERPVLVFPRQNVAGVSRDGTVAQVVRRGVKEAARPHTYDWNSRPFSLANTRGVRATGRTMPLAEALKTEHANDAHAVNYVVRDRDGSLFKEAPRVNLNAIAELRSRGYDVMTLSCWLDIDNPKADPPQTDPETNRPMRVPWDDALQARSDEWMATVPLLRYAQRYITRRGQRFVIWFAEPIPTDDAPLIVRAIARELTYDHEIPLDENCFDATRFMRLPNVVRDDTKQRVDGVIGEPADALPWSEQVRLLELGLWLRARDAARGASKSRSTREPSRDAETVSPAQLPLLKTAAAAEPDDEPRGEPADEADEARVQDRPRAVRAAGPTVLRDAARASVPARYAYLAEVIGAAVDETRRASPHGVMHDVMLHVGGALLWRGVPAESVPAIVEAIAARGGSTDPAHHRETAQDTLQRALANGRTSGLPTLARKFPLVARALQIAFARGRASKSQKDLPTADEAYEAVYNFIRYEIDTGVHGVWVRQGVGKTTAAENAIVDLVTQLRIASLAGDALPASVKRAARVWYSGPTHALNDQVVANLRARNVSVRRLFSPAHHPGPHDGLACRFPHLVRMLAGSGASVQREACLGRGQSGSRCPHYDACDARLGADGPEAPDVVVASHAKLDAARGFVGGDGLIVVDEPGHLTEDVAISSSDLGVAWSYEKLPQRYRLFMRPILRAVRAFVDAEPHPEPDEPVAPPLSLTDIVRRAFDLGVAGVEGDDLRAALADAGLACADDARLPAVFVRAAAQHALAGDDPHAAATTRSCPVPVRDLTTARYDRKLCATLGVVISTYNVLYDAACGRVSPPAFWRALDQAKGRGLERGRHRQTVLLVKRVAVPFAELLGTADKHRVVLLDGNLDLHRDIVEIVAQRPVTMCTVPTNESKRRLPVVADDPVVEPAQLELTDHIVAKDARPCERVQWMEKASRATAFDDERRVNWEWFQSVLTRVAGEWLDAGVPAVRVGLVTFKPVALALGRSLGLLTEGQASEFAKYPDAAERLRAVEPVADAVSRTWCGRLAAVGTYGAMRGLNSWREFDGLVTIGDPRPPPDAVRREVMYVASEKVTYEQRYEDLVRAELDQVHDRLRQVRRTEACRCLHVGQVTPGGVGWSAEVKYVLPILNDAEAGESTKEYTRRILEAAINGCGGQTKLAEKLGILQGTVSKYVHGRLVVPELVLAQLIRIVAK